MKKKIHTACSVYISLLLMFRSLLICIKRVPIRKFSTTTTTSQMKALPFKISRKQADEILMGKQGFLEKGNGSVTKGNELIVYEKDPVRECFVPFYAADIKGLT